MAGPRPDAREDHTWTVHAAGRTAYLFGGRGGGTAFGDLWAFDLGARTWTRLEPAGPSPDARFGHEAAWVDGVGLVVTLGQAGSRFFNDIWAFDPATSSWRELPAAGDVPVARYGSCSGVAPDGRLWISHGFTAEGARFADTRAYDFGAGRWADVTPTGDVPVKRCLHACWWTSDGEFVLYGGQTNGAAALGDLWRVDPASGGWAAAADPGPAARQLAAVGRTDGLAVVFGGRDVERRPLDDTWV
ncbi:MAG TPA: kelch repeat-containing protein, partial [Candidatus Binatia bacterium]|nr:kelch repeat-containing protein [Candidatus Binatia bacterium]